MLRSDRLAPPPSLHFSYLTLLAPPPLPVGGLLGATYRAPAVAAQASAAPQAGAAATAAAAGGSARTPFAPGLTAHLTVSLPP